jgi:hypothetical protein
MSRRRYLALAIATAAAPVAFAAASGTAQAAPPSPGDPCTTLHATTQDGAGKTMWCNPTMTGNHSLVWQYGGPG